MSESLCKNCGHQVYAPLHGTNDLVHLNHTADAMYKCKCGCRIPELAVIK